MLYEFLALILHSMKHNNSKCVRKGDFSINFFQHCLFAKKTSMAKNMSIYSRFDMKNTKNQNNIKC